MVRTDEITRRTFVVGILAGVAGCLGNDDDDEPERRERRGPEIDNRELSSAFPLILEDADTGDRVADVHYHDGDGTHWHAQPITVPLGDARVFMIRILDEDEEDIPLGDEYTVEYVPPEENESIVEVSIDGHEFAVHGLEEGRTRPRLRLEGPTGDEWVTPQVLVDVEPANE